MDDDLNRKRYEFKLSFWQVMLNRKAVLASLLASAAACGVCVWKLVAGLSSARNVFGEWLTLVSLLVFLLTCFVAAFGYGRWTRKRVVLEIGPDGVSGVGPHRFLSVVNGFAKTSVIRSLTGHFVIVPNSVVSKVELTRIIKGYQLQQFVTK